MPSHTGRRQFRRSASAPTRRLRRAWRAVDLGPPLPLHPWRHNLPAQPDALIGRDGEVATLLETLQDDRTRLVTLTGVGGSGKTRLAMAAAAAWLDATSGEASFVDLAVLSAPEAVLPAIAAAIGVQETAGVPLRDAVAHALRPRRMLLVLDNFEHLLPAALEVNDLLTRCPNLKVLATSRERLDLRLEHEFQVAPLALPTDDAQDPDSLLDWPSIALFVERARAVAPQFSINANNAAAVVDVCRRLDGLPLAIELAAAFSRILTPGELADRLGDRFDLLTSRHRDVPARHRTLAQAIGWSYELLPVHEQALFREMAVFTGGWTLAAAEAVSLQDTAAIIAGLESLVAKSLVQVTTRSNGQPRFRFLETVRAFAGEQLNAGGQQAEVRQRHARYYLHLMEQAEAGMIGSEQDRWFPEIEAELENCRSAMRWFLAEGDGESAVRFGGAFTVYWYPRGHFDEGSAWLIEALGTSGADTPTPSRVRALCRTAGLLLFKNDTAAAQTYAGAALALARQIDDADSIGQANHVSGLTSMGCGDWSAARRHFQEALQIFRSLNDWWWQAWSLDGLGQSLIQEGKLQDAHAAVLEALDLRRNGADRWGTAESLERLGQINAQRGELDLARSSLVESITLRDAIDDRRGEARGLEALAAVEITRNEFEIGARLMGAADAARDALGSPLLRPEVAAHESAARRARARMGDHAFAEAVQAGRLLSSGEILELAAHPGGSTQVPRAVKRDRLLSRLTTREREVAILISRGYTSREIADLLVVSVRTADTHADHIRDKLGLKSRAEIAAWSVEQGLTAHAAG